MLFISDTETVPQPDGWCYYVEQTNFTVCTRNYNFLMSEIEKHCTANGIAVPTPETVITQMCERLRIPCFQADSMTPLVNAWTLNIPRDSVYKGCCGR